VETAGNRQKDPEMTCAITAPPDGYSNSTQPVRPPSAAASFQTEIYTLKGNSLMSSRNLIAVALLALAMLVGGGAMVVHAIPGRAAPGDGDNIGMVDMERLYSSSDLPQVLAAKANQLNAQVQDRLDTIADAKYLDTKELQEYVELVVKVQPDANQQARIKELKALSAQRGTELADLIVKQAPIAADKVRQRDLIEMSHLLDKVLPGIRDDMMADAADRMRAVRRDQITQLRTIVGQVAKEKGVVHVFDANALVYSANDLTPLVLKKLKPGK
jgi:Skp family chaperone for outer membrane proteins